MDQFIEIPLVFKHINQKFIKLRTMVHIKLIQQTRDMNQLLIQTFLNYQFSLQLLAIIPIIQQDGGLFQFNLLQGIVLNIVQYVKYHLSVKLVDGSCIGNCSSSYQILNGTYCYDFDDETPYSKYLIQEFVNSAFDPQQYAQYTLVSQSGINFLKGSNIYYSNWQEIRVFGGPYVWAQAKFQRIYNIIDPHHSITIAFYILYGPSFPEDGSFIYTIDNYALVTKSKTSYFSTYSDESRLDKVYQRISHNINTLTITWECFGLNNEPIKAYCGFFNYHIAVHYCQPYCLQCLDQNTCTQWNSTYDASIVRFSQSECESYQYFDRDSFRCLQCHSPCLTCTSKIDCQTCQSTFTQTKLGCICLMNQYEDQNQCFNCPIECTQCLSASYCLECLFINNRQLVNGQCNCLDGYYPIASNPQCQQCHQFCNTCTGPTSDECLTYPIKTCSFCHYSCSTCFRTTIEGCLTCNPALNRILKGLKCECAPGYFELNNVCTSCPSIVDTSLTECYKQCNNSQQIWHTNICNSCDSGFQLVSGECQPICGDLQIKGYEQCEDNNTIFDDLCYNCQFQCPLHCEICDLTTSLPCPDICGDGIITGNEQCEDGNSIQYDGCFNCQYQCQLQCTKCIKGECIECATNGWFIDPTVTPWQCRERCGDYIIVGTEQCEDGNSSDTDGCKDCKYFCRIGCSSCNYTNKTCLSCEFPGFTPDSYYCRNICGDGLVVVDPYGFYYEECDDGNTISGDGCSSSCQYQCQSISICTTCVSNRCELCASGYLLTTNKICVPICGDAILVTGEQCDDGLTLPYKGCQNCKARCQRSCLTCSTTGLGCNTCKTGYTRIDYLCYSICGDQIVTEDEQCDDGNLILGDGCHFCQYSCQDECLNCIKGICYDCLDGYKLIQSKCYPICGNGIIQKNEQCEIQNQLQTQINCKSCKLSCDMNCVLCLYGICQQCIDGYELSLNQLQCYKSLQNTNFALENCLIQIRNSCYKCQDYAYYDQVEQKCKSKESTMSFCQYYLKIQPEIYCNQCFEYCSLCNNNTCVDCQTGYYLDENQQCNSFCGDGILSHDEQCEINDQNCLSCMLEAPQLCELQFQNLCFQCEYGYYYNYYSNLCESKCGDGIITHDEDCEDNNYQDFDGCYQCKYSCSQQCINCLKGVCQECELGFFLYEGFCFNGDKVNECSMECKICQQAQCLLCEKEYKFNEYGDCVPGCQEGCINCSYSQCLQCGMEYYLYDNKCILIEQCSVGLYLNLELLICESQCGDGFIKGWEECDDQNSQQFDGCYSCKYECFENCIQCIQGECLQCSTEFNLIENQCLSKCQESCLNCVEGVCQLCSSGYYLNEYYKCTKIDCEYDFSCTQECGNGIIEAQEQCDDQNFINGDSCNNYCELTCDPNCISCVDGICLQCAEGWIFNLFFCKPICGDSIMVGNEECDDGNSISFDGCFQCQFQCIKFCEDCQQGVCQSCQTNFELDLSNNSCKPIQNQVLTYTQPDCKQYNNDQCIQCQAGYLDLITNVCIINYSMNKCTKNCKYCVHEKCLECEQGYYGNRCTPKCGDGLIVKEEECDDGSSYQLDSCLNCKYQCPEYCSKCAYGVCTQCYQGFYLDIVSNSCNSICGDKILANDEVCDDGNELRYDGCFECKFQFQMECLDCQFGKCNLCEPPLFLVQSQSICEQLKQCEDLTGLYYDILKNDCLPQCGDGITASTEQCDDENQIKYDGCFDCQYQCHEMCNNCQEGNCMQCNSNYLLIDNKCIVNQVEKQEEPLFNNEQEKVKDENYTSIQNDQDSNNFFESVCRNDECIFSPQPKMQLDYNYFTFNIQHTNQLTDHKNGIIQYYYTGFRYQKLQYQALINLRYFL
ncbi:unnamed protein product [Paramecium sonneborni]|uniref:EGF-like domain-containing protein n=1 Tax=Paramecium sonneborni TaxID=65129 RepID=A0A8S1N880_9CILI|nr:unnamed protein product [Paramecium sonneborni]